MDDATGTHSIGQLRLSEPPLDRGNRFAVPGNDDLNNGGRGEFHGHHRDRHAFGTADDPENQVWGFPDERDFGLTRRQKVKPLVSG